MKNELLVLREKYDASFREIEALTGIMRTRLHTSEEGKVTLTKEEMKLIKKKLRENGKILSLNRYELIKLLAKE